MARRVALARTITLDPQIALYDEPFAGLDPISLSVVGQLIRRLNDALDMTSILVTHGVAESLKIVDYIYFFLRRQGRRPRRRGVDQGQHRSLRPPVRRRRARRPGALSLSGQESRRGLRVKPVLRILSRLGHATIGGVERLGFAARFFSAILRQSGTSVVRPQLVIKEIYQAGVLSLIIVLMSGMFIGMVLALQGYETLVRFGATESMGVLVALSLVRELGPTWSQRCWFRQPRRLATATPRSA